MPNDLTISGIGTPVASPSGVQSCQPGSTTTSDPKASGAPATTTALRVDGVLGILVIEFLNEAGEVSSSIPTQRQLEAYQFGLDSGTVPAPQPLPGDPATSNQAVAAPAASPDTKPGIVA